MNRRAAGEPPITAMLRRLIAKSFPELKPLNLTIAFRRLDDDECLRYDCESGRYAISINDFLRAAPRRALEGGIAHELCHLLHDSRLGPLQRRFAYDYYAHSAAYRIRDERATEIRQIERGYGPHLLAFLRYARISGYTFSREHGLPLRELIARRRTAPYLADDRAKIF